MTEDDIAEAVAKSLARLARQASIPTFVKIAFADNAVAVETIDGGFFELTVQEVDGILFPQGEQL